MKRHLGLSFILVAFVIGACGADTTVGTDSGVTDLGVIDASLSDLGSSDVGTTPDEGAAVDAGGDFILSDIAYRLAYFPGPSQGAPAFVDLCWRRQNGPTEWTRGYGAPGVGYEQVGRYIPLERGNHTFRIIDVNGTCDSPIFESIGTTNLGGDSVVSRPTFAYLEGRRPGVLGTLYSARLTAADIPGVDRLAAYDFATAAFIEGIYFDDGATRSRIGNFLDVPAGTTGSVVVDIDGAPDHIVPYRAGSAVSTSIVVTGDGTAVSICDDFAAPNGTLAACSPTLRAP